MRFTWNENKRRTNLKKHGLDFVDAESVFAGLTLTIEDERFDYEEHRFTTMGMIGDIVVVVAHTETEDEMRVISMRKATKHEQEIYFENISD